MTGRFFAALLFGLTLVFSNVAGATETLKWEDLAPPWDESRNPVRKMSEKQKDDVYAILWGPSFDKPGAKLTKEEVQARANLKAMGVNPDALIAKIRKLRRDMDKRDQVLVKTWNGRDIKIPGYVLPLEFSGKLIKEFLLVPYVGACIHVPPPPPNQILHVKLAKGFQTKALYEPVWVTGRMSAGKSVHDLSLVDGASKVSAGYSLSATKVEPYKK